MMGPRQVAPGYVVLRVLPGGPCPERSCAEVHRPICRSLRCTQSPGAVLQRDRAPLDRSGVDDPDASDWVCHGHTVRAAPLRGGASELGVSLVLQARSERSGSGSFDVLEEPPRAVPGERSASASVRDCGCPLHRGRAGRWECLRCRCLTDQGPTRTSRTQRHGKTGTRPTSIRRRRRAPFASTWTCWTMPPSARQAKWTRSLPRIPIRPRNGPAR